jgi:hypothetical protein
MEHDADRVVAEILHADEGFLVEIGRLTLLFSRIEDRLVHDTLELAKVSSEKAEQNTAPKTVAQLRILEKRDLLKRAVGEIGRYYSVDHSRLDRILDELSNINRIRRTVVHGWIRWSAADERPILVDSRGQSVPAWPANVADLNLKVLDWLKRYYTEQHALMRQVLDTYDALADRLLRHPKATPAIQALVRKLKTNFTEP